MSRLHLEAVEGLVRIERAQDRATTATERADEAEGDQSPETTSTRCEGQNQGNAAADCIYGNEDCPICPPAPGPAWDAESDRIEAEIAADREEALRPEHVSALNRADKAEDLYVERTTELMEVSAERDRLLTEIHRITAQRDFLLEHIRRLVDRLAGAKMLAGETGLEAATAFVNAERQGVNQVLERIGAGG